MSVNTAILIGNVGQDPVVSDRSGLKVANFSLATTDKGYTRQDGTQVPERTEWHKIAVFGRLAETCEKYVRKGAKLYVCGAIRHRKYTGSDGVERSATEIHVDKMEMLDRPAQQQQAPQPAPVQPAPQPAHPAPQPAPAPAQPAQQQAAWQAMYPQYQSPYQPQRTQQATEPDTLPF